MIAIYVKQTGILLTLAFDLLLACLVVPFILGLVWRRGTSAAAMVSIVVGLVVRLVLFVMTPTMYGVDNTILYIPNGFIDASFDGWPTFIAFAAALVTYVAVSLMTPPATLRGLDIQVAQDVDDALDSTTRGDREQGVCARGFGRAKLAQPKLTSGGSTAKTPAPQRHPGRPRLPRRQLRDPRETRRAG